MAAEEMNKPALAKQPAAAPAKQPESNAGNGDMAHLIGNMGILIDSTIESVQDMISRVSSATGQLIEGVTTTMNSDQVKEMISNVNSVSGQLIDGVTTTLQSEQIQSSFKEMGKLWTGILDNINTTVNSGQVQNMFENVSAGLGQLLGSILPAGIQQHEESAKKEVKQIPFSSQESASAAKAPAPAPAPAPTSQPKNFDKRK